MPYRINNRIAATPTHNPTFTSRPVQIANTSAPEGPLASSAFIARNLSICVTSRLHLMHNLRWGSTLAPHAGQNSGSGLAPAGLAAGAAAPAARGAGLGGPAKGTR